MCARVSRTEGKLEPIGLVNCSAVNFSAAASNRRLAQALYSNSGRISSGDILRPSKLERTILGESETGQCCTCGDLGNFDADRRRIGSIHLCWTKHRILGEHFAVDFGHEIILAIFVFAPNLPELDGLNCHISPGIKIEVTGGSFQSTGSTAARQCSEVVVNIEGRSGPSDEGKTASVIVVKIAFCRGGKMPR